MDELLKVWDLLKGHTDSIVSIVAHLVLIGSIIVKFTPTLKDDNYFKGIIKFIGKYVALDKYGPPPQ